MSIHLDHFRKIGDSHQFCQDYSCMNKQSVVLSDGCSGASRSDIGAFLLSINALNLLEIDTNYPDLAKSSIHIANSLATSMKVEEDAMAATLVTASFNEHAQLFNVSITGDGLIVYRDRFTKDLTYISVEFDSGAPLYPRYYLNQKSYLNRYLEVYPGKRIVCVSESDGEKKYIGGNSETLCFDTDLSLYFDFPVTSYDLVAIFTDGIKTFTKNVVSAGTKTTKQLGIKEIVPDLLDFKSMAGSFLLRRCKKVFQKFTSDGISHSDDFSMGVLYAD